MEGFETLLRDRMVAQPVVAEGFDTLVCHGVARFIAQLSLYSQSLGMAIAQTIHATDASGAIQALRQLLEAVELKGVMEQWPGSATIIAVRSHGIREGMATLAHDIKGLLRLLGWRESAEEEPPIECLLINPEPTTSGRPEHCASLPSSDKSV